MKKLLLAGVTLVSIAALAPASAQQAGSANQPMSKSSTAQQNGNGPASNMAGQQQTKNAAQPSRDEIKQAQEALDQKGFHVSADGVLGPQTKQAVTQFQQQQKLQQTGELDQQTMSALGISQAGSTTGQGNSGHGSSNMQQPSNGGSNMQQPWSGMRK